MFCEVTEHTTIYDEQLAGQPGIGGWFPGGVRLASGELLVFYSTGEEFEGRMTLAASRSTDGGHSWVYSGPLFGGAEPEPGNLKPTLLRDGRLAAIGYNFTLSEGSPLVNPATGGLAPGANYIAFSSDGGHRWTPPQRIDTRHPEVLETSGPCLELGNGDLIASGTPFPMWDGRMPSGRKGFLLRSTDGGRSWADGGIFFQTTGGNVAPYESRMALLPGGRIAIILWCLDEAVGKSRNNHVVFSDDNGFTWSPPLDTGIAGQASNLLALADGTLLAIHCVREGDDTGLHLCRAVIRDGRWEILQHTKLWEGARAGRIGSLAQMGDNLKFGQPSILALPDGDYLALHWAMTGKTGRILAHRFRLPELR